jgi:hypothetical protein
MSSEQTYSINAAAKLTGFTIPTIRRRLPELKRAGATLRDNRWSIPLSALYAVGLMSKVEPIDESKPDNKVSSKDLLSETIDDLRQKLAQAEQRAAVAEALASEREKALERADRALLMLEAGKGETRPARGFRWLRG